MPPPRPIYTRLDTRRLYPHCQGELQTHFKGKTSPQKREEQISTLEISGVKENGLRIHNYKTNF